jgi:TetR/AcrR family transcriptional regulator, transcriptional repressor for nem operon
MSETKDRILEIGRRMVQSNGYNALSFREIALEIGIKSAAVHYHFPTKGDLGAALAKNYTEAAATLFEGLLRSDEKVEKLFADYTAIFRAALTNGNRMCLYGIMAAEYDDLPGGVRVEIDHFTEVNLRFIAALLARSTPIIDRAEAANRALAIFSAIEGAQLVARGRNDITLFDKALEAHRAVGLFPR